MSYDQKEWLNYEHVRPIRSSLRRGNEGISAVEAMACGLARFRLNVATHQYALCPESLFRAGDADSLAERIDYWIEHPEKSGYRKKYAARRTQTG